jgi:hypothetical protein
MGVDCTQPPLFGGQLRRAADGAKRGTPKRYEGFLFVLPVLLASGSAVAVPRSPSEPNGNVVSLSVVDVKVPKGLPGPCRLKGRIVSVLEGKTFRPGQDGVIEVPCGDVQWVLSHSSKEAACDVNIVKRSKFVVAKIDANGKLLTSGPPIDYGGFQSHEPIIFVELNQTHAAPG